MVQALAPASASNDGSGVRQGIVQMQRWLVTRSQACETAAMPELASYRPPQYAAAIVCVAFPGVKELCEYAHMTVDVFEVARRQAEDRGDEMIVLGTGRDDDGQMGEFRIVAAVHPGGRAILGMAPRDADADSYRDACQRMMLIRVQRVELMLMDVMVGVVRGEEWVTLQ